MGLFSGGADKIFGMAMLEIVNLTIGASLAGLFPYTQREGELKRIDAKLQKYCSILKKCIGLGA